MNTSSRADTRRHGTRSLATWAAIPSVFSFRVARGTTPICRGASTSTSESSFTTFLRALRAETFQRLIAGLASPLSLPEEPRSMTYRRQFHRALRQRLQTHFSTAASTSHRQSNRYAEPMNRSLTRYSQAPNHALQRTAPRVTVAAISSSNPSRASHLFL